jgi:membrane protein required for colicin V production
MNSFDAAVFIGLIIAVVTGFNAGLLRSGVTILAYLIAMPVTLWAMSMLYRGSGIELSLTQNSPFFFGIFLVIGLVLGKFMRMAVDDAVGPSAGIGDRLAGAALGVVRVGLVAVTLVVVFDQLVPAGRQPAFLNGSQLRPLLSEVGQKGFKSLPPDVAAVIDRFKREQRI